MKCSCTQKGNYCYYPRFLFAGGAFAGQGFSRGRAAGGLDGHGGGFLGIIWSNRLVGTWFLRIFAVGKSVLKRIYEHHR